MTARSIARRSHSIVALFALRIPIYQAALGTVAVLVLALSLFNSNDSRRVDTTTRSFDTSMLQHVDTTPRRFDTASLRNTDTLRRANFDTARFVVEVVASRRRAMLAERTATGVTVDGGRESRDATNGDDHRTRTQNNEQPRVARRMIAKWT
jgi:hypothetical protein